MYIILYISWWNVFLTQDPSLSVLVAFADEAMDFFELIVVLSGTCPITGNSLEARQSYTASDLRYNCVFAPCVPGTEGDVQSLNDVMS